MTVFFKNDTPERLAKLEGAIETLRAEFRLDCERIRSEFTQKMLDQQKYHDREMEEMENALLGRIEESEKSARGNSLKADEKAKAEESEQVGGGYQTWSQRKAKRILKSTDPEFAQKVLKRSQKAQPA